LNSKLIIIFFFIFAFSTVSLSRSYTIDELLKLLERNVQYDYLEKEIVPVNFFSSSSKMGIFPLNDQNQTGEWNFKLTFLKSLSFFSNLEYHSKKFYFENGIEWSLFNNNDSKDMLKTTISKKLELINVYFNLLKIEISVKRLKDSIDKTDNMWNTTLPIDYGLSRIEENYLFSRIKSMCGITEDFEISIPKAEISSLKLNLGSILNAVVYLNSPEKKKPKLSVIFSISQISPKTSRLNAGFNFVWENAKMENDNLSGETSKIKKLYSQFEYLKDVLKSYRLNLSRLENNSIEYHNVRRILEDYTIETYRLYYQLKILEEIVE